MEKTAPPRSPGKPLYSVSPLRCPFASLSLSPQPCCAGSDSACAWSLGGERGSHFPWLGPFPCVRKDMLARTATASGWGVCLPSYFLLRLFLLGRLAFANKKKLLGYRAVSWRFRTSWAAKLFFGAWSHIDVGCLPAVYLLLSPALPLLFYRCFSLLSLLLELLPGASSCTGLLHSPC